MSSSVIFTGAGMDRYFLIFYSFSIGVRTGFHGGADLDSIAAGGSRSQGGRDLPQSGNQPGDVLSVEAAVFGSGSKRAA